MKVLRMKEERVPTPLSVSGLTIRAVQGVLLDKPKAAPVSMISFT